jgi:hypothetical protein
VAVTSINEIWSGRTNSVDDLLRRQYARRFRVITDSTTTGPVQIRLTSGLPARYDPYVTDTEFDLAAVAKKIDCDQTDDPYVWEVTVSYDTEFPELKHDPSQEASATAGAGAESGNPINEVVNTPPEISWSTEKYQRAVDHDVNDNAIANKAGVKFKDVQVDDSRLVLTITRRQLAFDYTAVWGFLDYVNSDDWYGIPAGKAKFTSVSATRKFEKGVFHWDVTYTFHIRYDGWQLSILNAGRQQLVSGVLKAITDPLTGTPVPDPVPLNTNGTVGTPNTFNFCTFQVYPTIAFATLGLP